MLLSILKESFFRQKKAMAMMVVSVAMGTAIASSLLALSMDIKGKVSKELRSFGANITVEPKLEGFAGVVGQKRYLREEDIVKVKAIFWRHNIMGVAPFLETDGEVAAGKEKRKTALVGTWIKKELPTPGETVKFSAGVVTVAPWWNIDGELPDAGGVLAGFSLAEQLGLKTGDGIRIDGREFRVNGIVSTGGKEDSAFVMELGVLQELKGLHGKISRASVSALTTPMDEFAYKDPLKMSKLEYEKWYCTGYVTSISKQIEEVFFGSRARPVWNIAETEGKILERMSLLVYLLSGASLLAAAIGVATTMVAGLLRRIEEIGLMKSIGADSVQISMIFLSEALIIGLVGGLIGYIISLFAVKYIGQQVFGSALTGRSVLFPIAILSALAISTLGSLLPIRRALGIKPAVVLKGA